MVRYRDRLKQLGIICSRKNERAALLIPMNFYIIRILPKCVRLANGCLEFRGNSNGLGYGQIRYKENPKALVTRITALAFNLIDSLNSEMLICHSCNNPKCVEIGHLRADTQKGNLKQMTDEGRRNNQYTISK